MIFQVITRIDEPTEGEKVKGLYIDKRPREWDYFEQYGGLYSITIHATSEEINKLYELNNRAVSKTFDSEDFEFALEMIRRDVDF